MKKLTLLLALAATAAFAARRDQAPDVISLITAVNDRWQSSHTPDGWAFWDEAVYHTGNIEAYRLTGLDRYLDYSTRWADNNQWKGARSDDPSRWRLDYGETDDHVLFGDWQTCFQTYIDLYNILPDDRRIARAQQVIDHQISTPRNDYWWWADGLYMAMPVFSKLHRLTGSHRYLDAMYRYIQYTDSVMYDPQAALYYRDGKYVYPAHSTSSGAKDFWARGDGWVLASLARVLGDIPAHWQHRPYFVDRYRSLAASLAAAQQPGGYWSRSILDEQHAPGYETSGTALITYGLLWGINNNVLDHDTYYPVVERAWQYLSTVALQRDNTIGYVQPIGEKAIPGQTVDARSVTNFGTGAWLLAACEYARYLQAPRNVDRAYWVDFATRLATPVLDNLSRGTLQRDMTVEVSPTWDGRDLRVTYMEAFGRLMAGIAPWLSLPDDRTPESQVRHALRQKALKAYANAVDPLSPDYLLWEGEGQALVDAAYIAQSFLRGWDALWLPLDSLTKQRYIDRFMSLRNVDPPYTNWLLFSSTIESFLCRAGAPGDIYRINSALRKVDEWYIGDGWYSDGPTFAFDYYNSYVIHPMYLETLRAMADAAVDTRIPYDRTYRTALRRMRKYSLILERLISPQGTFPAVGRSSTYRTAAMQPLALAALLDRLPQGVTASQARAALTAVMHNMFDNSQCFNPQGYLTIGFTGSQPNIADWYTNNGSLYITSLSLLPLGLSPAHPFWTDAPQPWTQVKAWSSQPFPKDHCWD